MVCAIAGYETTEKRRINPEFFPNLRSRPYFNTLAMLGSQRHLIANLLLFFFVFWQRLYGRAMAASQQGLAGLVDRSLGYDQALVNEQVPTRLGDGSVDVEVEGNLISPFTGDAIGALSIRASWLREAEPGSPAVIVGVDTAGRTLINVGEVHFT
jgi:hypothetical protein